MRVAGFEVGPGHPTFIVAEGGSCHGGSLEAALALTDAAADAGANAMKWQLWNPEKMYDPNQFPDEYASAVKWQLPQSWLPNLVQRAHERNLAFGCSAFDFDSLDFVDRFVDFHKVASIEARWTEFGMAAIQKGKPVLISNGMQDFGGYDWPISSDPLLPLHCVVAYPAELSDYNLRSHPKTEHWGLSDHTTHPTIAPCAAVALGACVIEKHLRPNLRDVPIDSPLLGEMTPDWPHSLSPDQFKEMVSAIRLTEAALGSGEKRIRPSEEKYLRYRRGPRGLRGS